MQIRGESFRFMRRVYLIGIILFSCSLLWGEVPSTKLKVPDGTILKLTITEALSSEKNHVNDAVHFESAEDVKIGDTVVIAKGAAGIGHVTAAEPKGKWGKGGKLDYSLDYIKAVDGSNVRLRATSSQSAGSSTGALMLGLSGAFKHGKGVAVAKDSPMSAYADGDHEVDVPEPSPATNKP